MSMHIKASGKYSPFERCIDCVTAYPAVSTLLEVLQPLKI